MKQFAESLLQDPIFSSWLGKCEGKRDLAQCRACNKVVKLVRSDLLTHAATEMHRQRMAERELAASRSEETKEVPQALERSVKKAEIRHVLDIVEHNRSFYSFEHFTLMLCEALPDSEVVKRMTLNRKHISAITKNVLNRAIVKRTSKLLQNKYFSIMMGKRADISGKVHLCILARYIDEGKVQTYLLDYLEIADGTSDNLYKCFKYALQKHKLPLENVISFSSNNTNLIVGDKNSFVSSLVAEDPEMIVFPCICHNFCRIIDYASKSLPTYLDELIHNIYGYNPRRGKRLQELEEIQSYIRSSCPRRYSLLLECSQRILQQWIPLFNFFAMQNTEHLDTLASKILDCMNSLYTKAYLQFLNYTLNIIKKFDEAFQSSKILLHVLSADSIALLWQIGGNFIKSDILQNSNLTEIDVFDENNLLPLESMFLSEEVRKTVNEIRNTTDSHDKIIDFYKDCRKFYQLVYQCAVKRLPLNDAFFKSLEFLDPSVALDNTKHKDQVRYIAQKFSSKCADKDYLIDEWYRLGFLPPLEKEKLLKLDIIEFWLTIGRIEKYGFNNISALAMMCLTLPHSNADVERFFSISNKITNQNKNKVKPETVAAICRVKLDFKNTNTYCYNYTITDDMFDLHNENMYKNESIPQELINIIIQNESEESDC